MISETTASTWARAATELGWGNEDPQNIGWYCSDRICRQGRASVPALIWENHAGEHRTYNFDQLRDRSDAIAHFLRTLGLGPRERICLFLDRVPELYIGFLGVLKMGGVAQPLFSAFGDEALLTRLEDAGTAAILTQRKHLPKVRKIRDRLPDLRLAIVVDAEQAVLRDGERAMSLDALPSMPGFEVHATDAETPSVLHYTSGTTGKPKGALHVHGSLPAQYLTAKEELDLRPDDIYWCNADPGWVTGTSYGIIGPWSCVILRHYLDTESGDYFRALGRYNGSLGQADYPSGVVAAMNRNWHYAPSAITRLGPAAPPVTAR